jgi:hypothetical protein
MINKNNKNKNLPRPTSRKKMMSRPFLASAETKISAGVSRVTGAAELIEMEQ